MDLGVCIDRNPGVGTSPFTRVFGGFEKVKAVRAIFGRRTEDVLGNLSVEVTDGRGYMRINDVKGSIVISSKYLKEGKEMDVYLDVIHELVHIRQHHEGKELWDKGYKYIDRPTEIEAYKVAVEEARRLGMSEKEVAEYLKVEWIPEDEFRSFLENVGVRRTAEIRAGTSRQTQQVDYPQGPRGEGKGRRSDLTTWQSRKAKHQ